MKVGINTRKEHRNCIKFCIFNIIKNVPLPPPAEWSNPWIPHRMRLHVLHTGKGIPERLRTILQMPKYKWWASAPPHPNTYSSSYLAIKNIGQCSSCMGWNANLSFTICYVLILFLHLIAKFKFYSMKCQLQNYYLSFSFIFIIIAALVSSFFFFFSYTVYLNLMSTLIQHSADFMVPWSMLYISRFYCMMIKPES